MKRFNLMCLLLALLVSRLYAADAVDEEAAAGNGTVTTATTEAPLLPSPPQCVYDCEGNRLNKGCRVEMPPKCGKGPLVSTMKGESYELCCCDFSNYEKYEFEKE